MAYDTKDHAEALRVYEQTGGNMAKTSRLTKVSKPTLYSWRKEGLPVEVTGGDDWDTYIAKREQVAIQRKRAEALAERDEWLDRRAAQVDQILDRIYDAITDPMSTVEIKASDYDKILRTKLLIENIEQEKIEFMQTFAAKILQIVAEVLDTGSTEWVQIRSRVMGLQKAEADKLDVLPPAS